MRTSRKSLFKRFGISALGESHFPNGLEFPRMAKVVSRMVWHFRAWRESFSEWFGVSALGESRFPRGLVLAGLPQIILQMVWSFRAWRESFPEWFEAFAVRGNICEKLGCVLQFVSDSLYFLLYNGIHLFGRRLFVAWIVPNDEP